jgi:hypothetical protein
VRDAARPLACRIQEYVLEPVQIQLRVTGLQEMERLVVVGSDLEFLLGLPRERLLTHREIG